jgi:hypothetical protein
VAGVVADEAVEGAEGGEPLVDGAGLDGEALVGEDFGFGEVVDGGVVACVGLDEFDEAARVFRVWAEDDDRPSPLFAEGTEDEGLRGLREGGRALGATVEFVERFPVSRNAREHGS